MLKKLRLDQKNRYEKAIAKRTIAKMVVAYAQARSHLRSIGSEQGGIRHWDDFVVEDEDGVFHHYQVKNQTTPFSLDECLRGKKKRGVGLKELSTLDEAIKSLADWTLTRDPKSSVPKRNFKLFCSDGTVNIKKEITVNRFEQFCNKDISDLSTVDLFRQLINDEEAAKNIWTWLSSFCDFSDEAHALRALKSLKIFIEGNEEAIRQQTLDELQHCYSDPATVLALIDGFLEEHSTYTSSITAPAVFKSLHNYILPGVGKWTQYHLTESTWKISGTADVLSAGIEAPSATVPVHWDPGQESTLRMNSRLNTSDLTKALIRLVFHLHNLSKAHLNDVSDWVNIAGKMVGYTLGSKEGDVSLDSLVIVKDDSYSTSESRNLDNPSEHDSEAARLNEEMDGVAWKETARQVFDKILAMESSDLRDAVHARWAKWKLKLDASKEQRNRLLLSMLSLNAEGKEIEVTLRLGPKTTELLRDGIFLLLVVSVCLTEQDEDWETFGDQLSVGACALSVWSGPVGSKRVQTILDDGIESLLGMEPSKVLILSDVKNSPSEVNGSSIASTKKAEDSLASPHQPKMIVTNSVQLRKMIQKGDLAGLKTYLRNEVKNAMTPANTAI